MIRRLGLQLVGRTVEATKLVPAKKAFRNLDPSGKGYITEESLTKVWKPPMLLTRRWPSLLVWAEWRYHRFLRHGRPYSGRRWISRLDYSLVRNSELGFGQGRIRSLFQAVPTLFFTCFSFPYGLSVF